MIRFVCECGRQLQAREDDIGKKAKCPSCNRVMNVPDEDDDRPRKRRRSRSDRGDDDRVSRRDEDDYIDDLDDVSRPAQSSGKATASMVFGLISICLPVFLPGIIGLTLGILALRGISASRGRLGGRGLAITGIVTSSLSFLLFAPCLILVGLLFPGLAKVSEAAARAQDQENLKQIGVAFHNFHDTNNRLPQSAAYRTRNGQPGLSWRVALLPHMGQDALFRRFKLDEAWDSPHNKALLAEMPPVYLMPNQPNDRSGQTHYQVFVGPRSLFEAPMPEPGPGQEDVRLGLRFVDVTDGVSNTILATTGRSPVPWTKPDDLPFDPVGIPPPLSDRVPGGFNVLLGDGSTRFLKHRDTQEQTLKALITRNGGEVLSLP